MKKHFVLNKLACAIGLTFMATGSAMATNGMNLEGYGPIALGMGGASMAYDNGTAAVMNNPATLGLMKSGHRTDVALGFLGPDVSTTIPPAAGGSGNANDSSADAFYMPALGYAMSKGNNTFGIGMFGQGGMGTEYAADSDLAGITGEEVRSEVGVMRVILPFVRRLDERVAVAASLDYVRATMDLKMAVPAMQMAGMSPSGAMAMALADPLGTGDWGTSFDFARFDFSDDNAFSGKASGTGFAGKLGIAMQLTDDFSIGMTYHSKTALSDLEASGASISMYDDTDGDQTNGAEANGTFNGKITVRDFEWPSLMGFGAALKVTPNLMLAGDVKRIGWSKVMESFKMTFVNQAGQDLNVTMPQYWEDQTVVSLGAAYSLGSTTLRAGFSKTSNPIPDSTVNPMFPAIIENHVTLGVGHDFNDNHGVNFAVSKAAEIKATNSMSQAEITHSQLSWQIMYSHRY